MVYGVGAKKDAAQPIATAAQAVPFFFFFFFSFWYFFIFNFYGVGAKKDAAQPMATAAQAVPAMATAQGNHNGPVTVHEAETGN